jgi:uncharacterized protein (TIGR00255 family)
MTGYGRGEGSTCNKKFTLELKAVNHRYSEVVLRLPRSLVSLEDRIRRIISTRVTRGRIDGYLTIEECGEKTASVKVDKALASAYYKAMKELQESVGIEGKIELQQLVALPGVFTVEEPVEDLELLWPAIQEATEKAVESLVQMRAFEGEELAKDLLNRVEHLALLNNTIRDRSPAVVEDYRERLQNRLSDFLKDGSLDTERLEAEVVLFAERSSITEETVRLESHLNQVRNCLFAEEAVGRKLDFLIQEMNREINTIASKASDLEISRLVVEVKSELEKLREQVQNIE